MSLPSWMLENKEKKESDEKKKEIETYPWYAQMPNIDGFKPIERVELEKGVFPKTRIPPISRYDLCLSNGDVIHLDDTQLGAINLVLSGTTCNIVGAAGTGKSTILQALLEIIDKYLEGDVSYRLVRANGVRENGPPVALIAFTNKAKNVIRNKILTSRILEQAGYGPNITTAHNLLEYTRVQEWSEERQKEVMKFVEQRNNCNPLEISHLVIDESSMLGIGKKDANQIGNKLIDACKDGVQLVLMGDINQIPPVGGKSILSYGLSQLPTAELKVIHRQALDSPIIAQAWSILQGRNPINQVNLKTESNFKVLHPKTRKENTKITAEAMNRSLKANLPKFIDKGYLVPGRDMVICPFNKERSNTKNGNEPKEYVSTSHINAVIGSHLAKKYERIVYHIIAGFNNYFLAVGDRVLVDKIEGTVIDIKKNASYIGKKPMKEDAGMDYWGNKGGRKIREERENFDEFEYDFDGLDIDHIQRNEDGEGKIGKAASHIVEVELDDDEGNVTLKGSGHFQTNVFSLGYAISIHKAQGSEWENVFVVLHDCHAIMLSRELLYTAVTRPSKNVFLIGQKHTIKNAVRRARIKGNSLEEKSKFFNDGEYLNAKEDFSFDRMRHIR